MIFLREFALEECFVSIISKNLSIVYQIKEAFVWNLLGRARKRTANPEVRQRRPPAFSDEQEEELVQLILRDATHGKFMKKGEWLDLVERRYKKILTYG
jgi:hypothetical protein